MLKCQTILSSKYKVVQKKENHCDIGVCDYYIQLGVKVIYFLPTTVLLDNNKRI